MLKPAAMLDLPLGLVFGQLFALLGRPGGATMDELLAATRARRLELTQALEALRDDFGYPVRRNAEVGAYTLAGTTDVPEPHDDTCLPLLYRAIACEEFIYLTFATPGGGKIRLHGLPGRIRSHRGRHSFKMRQRDGAVRRIDLSTVVRVQEAFGLNR
jgi:hypothetical protein